MNPGFTIAVENGKMHLEVRDAQGLKNDQQEWIEKLIGLVVAHLCKPDDGASDAGDPSTPPTNYLKARFRDSDVNNDTDWMRAARGRAVTLILPATDHHLDGIYLDGVFDDGGGPFWGIREDRFEVENEHFKKVTLNIKTHLKNR